MITILTPLTGFAADESRSDTWHVYTGTYTRGASEGIYLLEFDGTTGDISLKGLAAETENPSFLALHPTLPVIYAVGEMSTGGTVSAFRIEPGTGELTLINQQSSEGRGPCHVAVSPDGKRVATANYSGGSVAVLPVAEDGSVEKADAFFQHEGSGPNEQRQEKAHAHAVVYDKSGRFLVAADLGIDQLLVYRYDAGTGTTKPNTPPAASVEPGAGPRHFEFHPSKPYAYSINELDNTVTVFQWHEGGRLEPVQSIDTLPEDFDEANTTAEIAVHPSGRFVYASNRGHDSIVAYRVNEESGQLTLIGHTPTGGETPRNFALDPNGKYLLAANQQSDSVVVFAIDGESGELRETGKQVEVPTPVCLVFRKP